METSHYQVLIKQCPGGGVYFVGPEGDILAARSSIPEGAAYFLDNYAKAMAISPMELMLQMVARQPAPQTYQQQQPPPPVYQPAPMAPPPRPMEQAQPDNEPIPPGIIPDEAQRLAERIKASQRGNGSNLMSIAPLPLLLCLALAHAWPFGV